MKPSGQKSGRMPQIVVALDIDDVRTAKELVRALSPDIPMFKVGSQLFTLAGPSVIEYIRTCGAEVFLDLKFHDIPNTVACAVRSAVRHRVRMLTVHISGGRAMLEAAVKAAKEESQRLDVARPLLVGVTVLTSQEADPAEVVRLAKEGLESGLDGVVCSVREASQVRELARGDSVIVTPGIRPGEKTADDQKRVATVSAAVAAGSDFLVIGRPIVEAADPLEAAKGFLAQLREAASKER